MERRNSMENLWQGGRVDQKSYFLRVVICERPLMEMNDEYSHSFTSIYLLFDVHNWTKIKMKDQTKITWPAIEFFVQS